MPTTSNALTHVRQHHGVIWCSRWFKTCFRFQVFTAPDRALFSSYPVLWLWLSMLPSPPQMRRQVWRCIRSLAPQASTPTVAAAELFSITCRDICRNKTRASSRSTMWVSLYMSALVHRHFSERRESFCGQWLHERIMHYSNKICGCQKMYLMPN